MGNRLSHLLVQVPQCQHHPQTCEDREGEGDILGEKAASVRTVKVRNVKVEQHKGEGSEGGWRRLTVRVITRNWEQGDMVVVGKEVQVEAGVGVGEGEGEGEEELEGGEVKGEQEGGEVKGEQAVQQLEGEGEGEWDRGEVQLEK